MRSGGGGGGAVYDSAGSKYSAVSGLLGKKLLHAEFLAVSMVIIALQEVVSGGKDTMSGWFILRLYPCNKTLFLLLTVLLLLDWVTMYLKELWNVEKMYPLSIDQS